MVETLRQPEDFFRLFQDPSRAEDKVLRAEDKVLVAANLDRIAEAFPPDRLPALLEAIRAYLVDHPAAFHAVYAALSEPPPMPVERRGGPFTDEDEAVMAEAVAQLRQRGVAVCRGWYRREVEALREATIDPLGRAKAYLKSGKAAADGKPVFDEAMGCEYWGKTNTHVYGRYRAFFRREKGRFPEPIRRNLEDPRLHEIGRRYFNAPVSNGGVLAEFLEPAPATGDWHIDTIRDQFKVMVLLDDVREENGAMKVKPGTHRLWKDELRPMFHNIFAYGNDWCGVSEPRWQSLPQKTESCTGQAGDVILFDTGGLHTAAQCTEGYRLVTVSYFWVGGRKNTVLQHLGVR